MRLSSQYKDTQTYYSSTDNQDFDDRLDDAFSDYPNAEPLSQNDPAEALSDIGSESCSDDEHSEDGAYDDFFDDDDADISWNLVDGDLMDDGRGLTAEELLGEDFEREAADAGQFSV